MVPWARAGDGAIATQAWANVAYGPDGLGMLASGRTAEAVMESPGLGANPTPGFDPVTFFDAKVNDSPMGTFHPQWEMTQTMSPSSLASARRLWPSAS